MTTYYHGTDKGPTDLFTARNLQQEGSPPHGRLVDAKGDPIRMLVAGSYVTRHFKDAMKFGYRKAVTNGRDEVYIYRVDVDPAQTKPDPKRDRAFVIAKDCRVELLSTTPTFACAHKLRRFHLPGKFDP